MGKGEGFDKLDKLSWLERRANNAKVWGSIPRLSIFLFSFESESSITHFLLFGTLMESASQWLQCAR